MKHVLALALLLSAFEAYASCNVFVPEKEFHHDSGYSISFDFTSALHPKGYQEVTSESEADFVLKLEGTELEGKLHKAHATLSLGETMVSESALCLTQFCGISDYAKAFRKAYQQFSKKLPVCR